MTSQYFGNAAMFQIDIPALPERGVPITTPQYVDTDTGCKFAPVGTIVRKAAIEGRSRLVGPGAIYSLNPCTEEVVRQLIDEESRAIALVSLPEGTKRLASGEAIPDTADEDDYDIEEGRNE